VFKKCEIELKMRVGFLKRGKKEEKRGKKRKKKGKEREKGGIIGI